MLPRVEKRVDITGESLSPFSELSICSIPIKSTPKETSISPVERIFAFLPNIIIAAPTRANTGAKVEGLKS